MPTRELSCTEAARQCAKCGACSAVCPVYRISGREALSGRGKLHLLDRLPGPSGGPGLAAILSQCLLCGACQATCPRGLPIPALVQAARAQLREKAGRWWPARLAREILARPSLLAAAGGAATGLAALVDQLPADSGLRLRLAGFLRPATCRAAPVPEIEPVPRSRTGPAPYALFLGCYARHLDPELAGASRHLLLALAGGPPAVPADQGCCGLAAAASGDLPQARQLARRNIAAFLADESAIVVPCASCLAGLADYPGLFAEDDPWRPQAAAFAGRLVGLTELLADSLPVLVDRAAPADQEPVRVVLHDPCHSRFPVDRTAAPRAVLARLPGVTRRELPAGDRCCGHGGLFSLTQPRLSQAILARRLESLAPLAGQVLATTCSGCLMQWRQGIHDARLSLEVLHPAVLLARRLGLA
ncbi:MAG: (Fe-S)-binding protein [Thermodesulfobacteriota bacterium]